MYAGYTICTSREHIVYGAFCGSTVRAFHENPKRIHTELTLPQNALKRDCNGKCTELIEGHYLEVVVLLYI